MHKRWGYGVVLAALLAVLPGRGDAAFHLAVIDEILTSHNGDNTLQFVEIRMLAGGQTITKNSEVGVFDATGNYLGIAMQLPGDGTGNVPNSGTDVRWIMGTSQFAAFSGLTLDFTFNGPELLPTASGMVCWGKPTDATDPHDYVDCVAYGSYSGPTSDHSGTPTALNADGHSLVRVSETDDNATDFSCSNWIGPENNTGDTATILASSLCFVCGDNTVGGEEICDGTSDAACPGECQRNCQCPRVVPLAPQWGIWGFALLLLASGSILLWQNRDQSGIRD